MQMIQQRRLETHGNQETLLLKVLIEFGYGANAQKKKNFKAYAQVCRQFNIFQ